MAIWWVFFNVFLVGMLVLDLGVFHRKAHEVKMKEALAWSAAWIAIALLFSIAVDSWLGPERALEFLAGYLIEKSLSIDNIFVMVLILAYFRVPAMHQHKLLFWGVLGALGMRAAFIFAGIALIERFHWLIYVLGAFLVFTGVRMAVARDKEIHPERNPVLKLIRRVLPVTDQYEAGKFFVRVAGRLSATPLFVVLILVEITDLIFAVDSIPAILAMTRDPFVVYTSNALAILGLRSLYFALAGLVRMFRYLQYGLAAILTFVGAKMVLSDAYTIPIGISLGVVTCILAVSIVASLAHRPKAAEMPRPALPAEKGAGTEE